MATYCVRRCHSDYIVSSRNKISIISAKLIKNRTLIILLLHVILISVATAQYPTRDPRFYSREGDFNYNPPNPGDPDYR